MSTPAPAQAALALLLEAASVLAASVTVPAQDSATPALPTRTQITPSGSPRSRVLVEPSFRGGDVPGTAFLFVEEADNDATTYLTPAEARQIAATLTAIADAGRPS